MSFVCRYAAAAILAAAAVVPVKAQSQSRPDFSGVWAFDSARSEPSSFNPKSATWTVVQRGDSVILDRVSPNGRQQATYSLGGVPRKFTLRLVGVETEATSTVTWNGA